LNFHGLFDEFETHQYNDNFLLLIVFFLLFSLIGIHFECIIKIGPVE